MYTTPLSTLISHFLLTITFMQMILNIFSRSILATLTQVSPTSCSETHHISSWLSANLLTLNFSKTEFLIIGLKQQLSKTDKTTLHSIPLILHTTLVLSLMKILLSLIKSHHFLSPAILVFLSSAVSVLTLILKQPVPLLY